MTFVTLMFPEIYALHASPAGCPLIVAPNLDD
jgi:hypothetical protein